MFYIYLFHSYMLTTIPKVGNPILSSFVDLQSAPSSGRDHESVGGGQSSRSTYQWSCSLLLSLPVRRMSAGKNNMSLREAAPGPYGGSRSEQIPSRSGADQGSADHPARDGVRLSVNGLHVTCWFKKQRPK